MYVAPQAGIFNIKRGFREGGDGLEAVITELGDDVVMVIPLAKGAPATSLAAATSTAATDASKTIAARWWGV